MGSGTEREEQVLATNVSWWLITYMHTCSTKCSLFLQKELINVVHEMMGLVTYLPPRLRVVWKTSRKKLKKESITAPQPPSTIERLYLPRKMGGRGTSMRAR